MGGVRTPGGQGRCSVVGCHTHAVKRGWCEKHYQRWRKHGDPGHVDQIRGDDITRWWSKVDQSVGCWLWKGTITSAGYGHFWNNGKEVPAHRYGWELIVGPLAEGAELDHVCRNRACVKPVHLEPVKHHENIKRAVSGVCKKGHPLVPGNVYRYPKSGARLCVTCHPERRPNWFPEDEPEVARGFGAALVVREGDEEWESLGARADRFG